MIAPNKKTEKNVSPKKRRGIRHAAIVAFTLAIVASACWYFTSMRNEPEAAHAKKKKSGQISEQTPSSKMPRREEHGASSEAAPTNTLPPGAKFYGRSSNVPTDNTNNIHYATMDGIKVVDADGNEFSVRSTPIFKSRVDNMLWAAIRPGGMPSGLNAIRSRMRHQTGSDAAFLQAVRNQEIEIYDDDPPRVQQAKQMTIEVKDAIIKAMDEDGRDFDDIYAEISETTRKERMYERIAQEDYRKMVQARDAEAIRKYVEDMNPVMEQMGLKTLRVPSWAQEGADQE